MLDAFFSSAAAYHVPVPRHACALNFETLVSVLSAAQVGFWNLIGALGFELSPIFG